LEVVSEIYLEKQRIKALLPGASLQIPPIKHGSGTDRLIFHVTVEKPAA
jgi:hypothetical protein